MKRSTIIIWCFEMLGIIYLGACLWLSKINEITFLVAFLVVVLAVWANKAVKIQSEKISIDVSKDRKNE